MEKKTRIFKLMFLVFISIFVGLTAPGLCSAVAAESVGVEETAEVEEIAEVAEAGETSKAPAKDTDEVNFFLFFAIGIVLLLAVVAAVVVVIVSGTTAAVIISDEE